MKISLNFFFQHILIVMLSFDDFWSSNLKHNFLKNLPKLIWSIRLFFFIDLSAFVLEHSIFIQSLDSLNCIEVDLIAIDQCFQNQRCFDFCHQIDWIIVFVNSLNFDDFASFVRLAKIYNVDHQSFFVNDFQFDQTFV